MKEKKEKKEKKKNKKENGIGISYLFPYYKKHKGLVFTLFFVMISLAVVEFILPILSADVLTGVTESAFDKVIKFASIWLTLEIVATIIGRLYNVIFLKLDQKVILNLKSDVARKITHINMSTIDKTNHGVFIERLNEDVGKCSGIPLDIMGSILDCLTYVAFLIYIAFINIWFFIGLTVCIVCLWLFDTLKEKHWFKVRKIYKKEREIATGAYNEQIRGLKDLKCLNIRESTLKNANDKYKQSLATDLKGRFQRTVITGFRNSLDAIFEFVFIIMGIVFITKGWLLLSGFIVIYMYHGRVKNLTYTMSRIKELTTEAKISITRLYELTDNSPNEEFGNTTLDKVVGNIQIKNVTFAYDEETQVLKNLTTEIPAGKITAIVGRSGSGKSTILSLINKLYTPQKGTIKLDGVDIDNLTEDCLRNTFGMVSQTPYIFNTTIRENLMLVKPDATEEELINSLKTAQIYNFVKKLEKGIDSIVGENGVLLSGGQKQRLAIARVLLKNSPILLLDEATSALDNESQQKIVDAVNKAKDDHTIIIVAHRLSTIESADNIIVIDEGKLVDQGTHKYLYRHCPLYKELYKNEELAETLES